MSLCTVQAQPPVIKWDDPSTPIFRHPVFVQQLRTRGVSIRQNQKG
jgi:hypothetical protein